MWIKAAPMSVDLAWDDLTLRGLGSTEMKTSLALL